MTGPQTKDPKTSIKASDTLWVSMLKIENAEVTIFFGDKNKYEYKPGQQLTPVQGMATHVSAKESMFVYVEKKDPNKDAEVVFDAYVEIGPDDERKEKYSRFDEGRLQMKITDFNIDAECNMQKIWKPGSKRRFDELFDKECKNKESCKLKPEDTTLFYKMTDFCKDRITFLNLTSYDFIAVVGCTKDKVTVPLVNVALHKEKIGIIAVAIDILSVAIMFYMFGKLREINN